MTVPMWRITTNNKGEKMQAQKEKQDIKQENGRKTGTTCVMSTLEYQHCEYKTSGSTKTHKKAKSKSLSLRAYFHGMVLKLDRCTL